MENIFDAYMNVTMNLKQYLGSEKKSQIILVASALNGEGRSTCVKNLGIALANLNFKVAIADCDFRKPAQGKLFEKSSADGIANCMEQDGNISDFVQNTKTENLSYVAGGSSGKSPAEILSNKKMSGIFNALKEKFDLILVDTPPLLKFPDTLILNDYADGIILVVETNRTELKEVREVQTRLEQVNGNILGVILNKVAE